MTFTLEKCAEKTFDNITLYARLRDGEVCAYIAETEEGYVMYDAHHVPEAPSEEDGAEDISYHTRAIFPLSTDFENFGWKAVRRDTVDSRLIF